MKLVNFNVGYLCADPESAQSYCVISHNAYLSSYKESHICNCYSFKNDHSDYEYEMFDYKSYFTHMGDLHFNIPYHEITKHSDQ